jgi:hypothetical protein
MTAQRTDYAQLIADARDYCDDTGAEFIARQPALLANAMSRLQGDLNLSIWRRYVSHHVPSSQRRMTRLPEWLKLLSIRLTSVGGLRAQMEQRSRDYVLAIGGTGLPRCWAEDNENTILLGPIPDQNHPVEIEILKRLDVLSASNPENWLTMHAADALLWGFLVECEHYLVAPERVKEFQAAYGAAVERIKTELRGKRLEEYTPIREVAQAVGDA